jgi:hypothetical protein
MHTQSYTHLRNAATLYPDSPHDFKPPVKTPPNYSTGAPDPPPLPTTISARTPIQRNLSLSIRITDVAPVLRGDGSVSAVSADTSFSSEEPDPFDVPPAYSVVDLSQLEMGQ